MEILTKSGNLFSTPWKIIIPLGNSEGDHIWVMIFFYTKVTIFENFVCTPWKIIIVLGNSVGNHICVIQIHMGR